MNAGKLIPTRMGVVLLAMPLLAACSPAPTTTPAADTATVLTVTPTKNPLEDWVRIKMTDVNTGQPFAVADFSGKVVLLNTMAQWCPNCLVQLAYIHKMYRQIGRPADVILISLDVDPNEDEASLKAYADEYGFDWRLAVSPLMVSRALGNLYTAQYLNPPLDPMMIIDRQGNVHHLEYGIKDSDALQKALEPYLSA
jgi:peroxiredoxin